MYKFKRQVIIWESQFWERRLAPRVYDAQIDTTFALYHQPAPHRFDRAVRTGFPYVARHTPWYLDDRSLPEDEAFYRGRCEGEDVNNWGRETLVPAIAAGIAARETLALPRDRIDLGDATALTEYALLAAGDRAAEPELQDETLSTLGEADTASVEELQARLKAAEDELSALQATKTFRYSEPARRIYGRLKSRQRR